MGGDKLFKMHNGYKWYTEELYLCKTCFNEKYAEKKGLVKTLTGTRALVTGGCLGYFTAWVAQVDGVSGEGAIVCGLLFLVGLIWMSCKTSCYYDSRSGIKMNGL